MRQVIGSHSGVRCVIVVKKGDGGITSSNVLLEKLCICYRIWRVFRLCVWECWHTFLDRRYNWYDVIRDGFYDVNI